MSEVFASNTRGMVEGAREAAQGGPLAVVADVALEMTDTLQANEEQLFKWANALASAVLNAYRTTD